MKTRSNQLLSEAIQKFQHWRNTRPGRRGLTPPALQKLAVDLAKEIPTGKIVSSLKINHSMLKRWQQIHENTPLPPSNFVRLPQSDTEQSVTMPHPSVTFKYPNGVELTFSESPGIEMMSALIHSAPPSVVNS